MSKSLTPFLWFDTQAEEAASFYVDVFKDGEVTSVNRYPDGTPGGQEGTVMTVSFRLRNLNITALNGGPHYQLSPAMSFVIECDSQDEMDHFWDKLGEGGQEMQCGWLTDRFGVTWQVVPNQLFTLIQDGDREKANRVVQAMLQMVKIDIAGLEAAYAGE